MNKKKGNKKSLKNKLLVQVIGIFFFRKKTGQQQIKIPNTILTKLTQERTMRRELTSRASRFWHHKKVFEPAKRIGWSRTDRLDSQQRQAFHFCYAMEIYPLKGMFTTHKGSP